MKKAEIIKNGNTNLESVKIDSPTEPFVWSAQPITIDWNDLEEDVKDYSSSFFSSYGVMPESHHYFNFIKEKIERQLADCLIIRKP